MKIMPIPENSVLVNFNCPKHLKKQIDELCRYKNVSKTHVILFLLERYVREESQKLGIDPSKITYDDDLPMAPSSDDIEPFRF